MSYADAKDRDHQLWQTWKAAPSQETLNPLMRQMMPLIRREMTPWSNVVPAAFLENAAKGLALKAFHTYDPKHGTTLGTHTVNHLKKLSRTAYERQSSISVPEQKRLTFNTYHRVKLQLEDEHGRPPSHNEIADAMRLPPKHLQSIVDLVGKRELMESGDGPSFAQHMDDEEAIHLAWHDMTPLQRSIFERRTGYNNTKILDGAGIMKSLSISQGVLSYQLQAIRTLLERAQNLSHA